MERKPLCRAALDEYMNGSAPYNNGADDEAYMSRVNPVLWWESNVRAGFDRELVDLAAGLVGASCSSASLERYFSTMGFTYGELRNRLAVHKAQKLTFLYRVFRKGY